MFQRLYATWMLLSFLVPLAVQATEPIRVVGSTTVMPILAAAAERYRQHNPAVRITVSGGGSGVGVSSVAKGLAEIGMLSRDLAPEEKARLQGGAEVVAVARDAVAMAVSRAVHEGGVTHLTLPQIAAIYRGQIKNWRELGGPDSPILVIDKEASRGTRHVFAKVVLGDEKARAPGATIVTGSNNEEQAAIAKSDKAIGMISHAWLNDAVRPLAIGEPGKAVLPTLAHVADGSYPIQRELNILLPRNRSATVNAFVAFLLSGEGQRIVQQSGYLAVK